MLVALTAEGDAEQQPRLRHLVRSANLLPRVAHAAEVAGGAVPILLKERDLPESEVNDRVERRRALVADLVGVDELLELRRGRAGRRDVRRGDRDLYQGRERSDACERLLELPECSVDPGERTLDSAL